MSQAPVYLTVEKAALLTPDPEAFMRLYRAGVIAVRIIDGVPCVRAEAVEPFRQKGEQ